MTPAREALDRLVAGERYLGNYHAFVSDGRPDPEALDLLESSLRTVEGDARGEIARALVAVVERTDALWNEGGIVVRDPRVVRALVELGPLRLDDAKEVCLDALLNAVPLELLAPHALALALDLRTNPDATTLLVVARLKDPRAFGAVEEVLYGKDPTWLKIREGQATAAAYGDRLTELATLYPFVATTDPKRKSDLAIQLGAIGTPLCLRTLGEALRTPLVQDYGYIKRSCRVDVIAGLRRTFTDAIPLFENRFRSDDAYEAAENFVTFKLGVTWATPRPPFLFKAVLPH